MFLYLHTITSVVYVTPVINKNSFTCFQSSNIQHVTLAVRSMNHNENCNTSEIDGLIEAEKWVALLKMKIDGLIGNEKWMALLKTRNGCSH